MLIPDIILYIFHEYLFPDDLVELPVIYQRYYEMTELLDNVSRVSFQLLFQLFSGSEIELKQTAD